MPPHQPDHQKHVDQLIDQYRNSNSRICVGVKRSTFTQLLYFTILIPEYFYFTLCFHSIIEASTPLYFYSITLSISPGYCSDHMQHQNQSPLLFQSDSKQ